MLIYGFMKESDNVNEERFSRIERAKSLKEASELYIRQKLRRAENNYNLTVIIYGLITVVLGYYISKNPQYTDLFFMWAFSGIVFFVSVFYKFFGMKRHYQSVIEEFIKNKDPEYVAWIKEWARRDK